MLPPPPPPPPRRRRTSLDADASVRATDSDASHARLSAVRKHYLRDPFIARLVPRPHLVPARPPLINIGTYVRSEAIDGLVARWLAATADSARVQIVSLGAGSDTRFWRLATGGLSGGVRLQERLARYLEVDFAESTARKIEAIERQSELASVVGEFSVTGSRLTSKVYALQDVDLRDFRRRFSEFLEPPPGGLGEEALLDPLLPTLVIAECVLVYLGRGESDALLEWIAGTFSAAGVIVYEMFFGEEDRFGRVMRENLRDRNVGIPGADAYPTLEAQRGRLTGHGFRRGCAETLGAVRREYISGEELERIGRLELVDELEELDLVLEHYVVLWGSVGPGLASWGLERKRG